MSVAPLSTPAGSPVPASLDDLAAEGPGALAALHAGARTPVLKGMDGPLVGRMLAVPGSTSGSRT